MVKSIILTATVFAAIISSFTNIILSLLNNHRLTVLETKKQISEFNEYRYCRLYELVVKWNEYDTKCIEENVAFNKLLNLFMDDSGRYRLARPLLDKKYTTSLDTKKVECEQWLNSFVNAELPDGTYTSDFKKIKDIYFDKSIEFSNMLINAINDQLEYLLKVSD